MDTEVSKISQALKSLPRELEALHGTHSAITEGYSLIPSLHKAINVQVVSRKGYHGKGLRAKEFDVDIPLGTLFKQRSCYLVWREIIGNLEARIELTPAFFNGNRVWIISHSYDFEGLLWNEDILDYDEGKKLWLEHYLYLD